MENDNRNASPIYSGIGEINEPSPWYTKKIFVYTIILFFIVASMISAYFILNRPKDFAPLMNNELNSTGQFEAVMKIDVATSTPTSTTNSIKQQTTAPTPLVSARIPAVSKTQAKSTKTTSVSNTPATAPITKPVTTPVTLPVTKLVYNNDQYGFGLSFPSTWNGYKVTNETVPGTAGVLDFGFAQQKSIFTIAIYTRQMWDKSKHNDMTYYLGENARYAFIYNPALGGADQSMSSRLAEMKSILATFAFK